MTAGTLLRGGRVVSPSDGLDAELDVLVSGGSIEAIGPALELPRWATEVDVAGKLVVPGLIDVHAHVYGGLGFSDVDAVGVNLGVTTIFDAGGAGSRSWDEAVAVLSRPHLTDVYHWLQIRPNGIYGLESLEESAKNFLEVDVPATARAIDASRDRIKGIKVASLAKYGMGPLQLTKGVASILGVAVFLHVGDVMDDPRSTTVRAALDLLDAGDTVTHCFTGCPGNLLDADGRLYPEVHAALDRGVLFDVGVGSFNFSFDVAESALEQGLRPTTISSDLQQVNVTGPAHSLPHAMGLLMAAGMSLHEVIACTTAGPATSFGLEGIGTLAAGRQADIAVLEMEEGDFELGDTDGESRQGHVRLRPFLTMKRGVAVRCDEGAAQDRRVWDINRAMSYETIPIGAVGLSPEQRGLLRELAPGLGGLPSWDSEAIDHHFKSHVRSSGTPLLPAVEAIHASFLTEGFTPAVGRFLADLDRQFVVERLAEVGSAESLARSSTE